MVYMVDHGYNPGQHGRFEKHCGYEPALRVPLIIESRRDHIFSEYLENEEPYIKTIEWQYIFCSGKRARQDGYEIDAPTPGRYRRLYELRKDSGEFTDVASKHPDLIPKFEGLLLDRFPATRPDREAESQGLNREEAIEFYLRPRDAESAFRA